MAKFRNEFDLSLSVWIAFADDNSAVDNSLMNQVKSEEWITMKYKSVLI